MKHPFFTISIDFELFWGMRDAISIKEYGKNIIGGRKAIPRILKLFEQKNIHATWAVVGFISFSNKEELIDYLPKSFPEYLNQKLNPYSDLKKIGLCEKEDPYHYGYSLVKKIIDTHGMEIASHSFSHFYCKEDNKNKNSFRDDLIASKKSLNRLGVDPKTYIFCRNQYEDKHLKILKENGFKVFRGNEKNIIFNPKANKFFRLIRLIDSFINITGSNFSKIHISNGLINVPASRFLRPASKFKTEKFKVTRILNNMTKAAKNKTGFHLWWHPHNFGQNQDQNFKNLEKIINHFETLKDSYDMKSLNMLEASQLLTISND